MRFHMRPAVLPLVIAAGALATTIMGGCQAPPSKADSASMRTEAMLDDFEKGSDRAPTPRTLYRMAQLLTAQERYDRAEATLRACIEHYPEYLPAYAELASLQVRRQRPAEAADTIREGLALAPNDPVLLNDLGMCNMLNSEYGAARDAFRRAVDADPDNVRYHANLALATGMMGDYEEALVLYQRILLPYRAHYNLGVICEALNDHERAAHEFAVARAMTTGNVIPTNGAEAFAE